MRARAGSRLVLAAKIVVLGAFLFLLGRSLSHADWSGVGWRLRAAGPAALLVLVPLPLALTLDVFGWKLLLARVSARVRFARLFRVRVSTEALTTALPAGGLVAEALAPFLLAPDPKVHTSITSSATKRWLIVRAHGCYVAIAALIGFSKLDAASRALFGHGALPWIAFVAAAALVTVSFLIQAATARLGVGKKIHDGVVRLRASRLFSRYVPEDLPRASFEQVDVDLGRLGRAHHLAPMTLLLGAWFFESIESFIILRVLGVDIDWFSVLSFDAMLSVVRAAAVFTPSGLGVQDLGYLAFFQAYQMPNPTAIGPAFLLLKRAKDVFYVSLGITLLLVRSRKRTEGTA